MPGARPLRSFRMLRSCASSSTPWPCVSKTALAVTREWSKLAGGTGTEPRCRSWSCFPRTPPSRVRPLPARGRAEGRRGKRPALRKKRRRDSRPGELPPRFSPFDLSADAASEGTYPLAGADGPTNQFSILDFGISIQSKIGNPKSQVIC